MEAFDLRRGLLLGAAIGGVRSDGVTAGNPWGVWAACNLPHDGAPFGTADHWKNWRADADLMHGLGLETCRLTADWARIEPAQEVFDDAAIAHLREEILYLRALGIRVVLVLHEFSLPAWVQRLGGWTKPDTLRFFLQYTEKLVRTVGHLVEDYVPVSQPNLYAWCAWYTGAWPPARKSALSLRASASLLVAAHIEGYRLIHALRRELGLRDTRVGASIYMRMPRTKSGKKTRLAAGAGGGDRLLQTTVSEAAVCGRFSLTLRDLAHAKKGSFCDFHDLCCYALPDTVIGVTGAEREPDSDELLYCAARCSALLRRPIFITEGPGLSAPSPRRIYENVRALSAAGLPVERWFSLAFADGFEWTQGSAARLGLVSVDPAGGKRSLRPAAMFLSRMIRNRGVTEEMCAEYGAPEQPAR